MNSSPQETEVIEWVCNDETNVGKHSPCPKSPSPNFQKKKKKTKKNKSGKKHKINRI